MKLEKDATVSHFKILSRIGQGGMGVVYLAQDMELDRRVALKFLPEELSASSDRIRRFIQEAKAASALNHPNILTVYEIGKTDDTRYIATEYIEGQTLQKRLLEKELLPLKDILKIGIQVAEALTAAHRAGIVHRDIKPGNIVIRPDGYVKVLDFGLAKLTEENTSSEADSQMDTRPIVRTREGMIIGTASYMSPEQVRGIEIDERTDIWSLGVVLYEMLSGRLPFKGETVNHTMVAILEKEPLLLKNVPDELQRIVRKALTKDREMRYQIAKDLLIDLKGLKGKLEFQGELERSVMPSAGEPVGGEKEAGLAGHGILRKTDPQAIGTETKTTNVSDTEAKTKSRKSAVIAILAILLAGVAIAGYYFYFSQKSEAQLTDRDVILLTDFENTTGEEIFDGTLKQGLTMSLEQSPFLSIFSDSETHNTLTLMKLDPLSPVTREIGRDICLRKGLKAYVTGTISRLGSVYVLGLEAVNAKTGATIARSQAEAAAEDQKNILTALSKTASELREKLGEPLSQIEKFDKPLEVTTSSMEALQAYTLAEKAADRGDNRMAAQFAEKAVELDPEFASAYSSLSGYYLGDDFQVDKSRETARKAYELRDKVTEKERFAIEHNYLFNSEWNIEGAIDSLRVAIERYPRDELFQFLLAMRYRDLGEYEKAYEEHLKALEKLRAAGREIPAYHYTDLAWTLIRMNRFGDARNSLLEGREILDEENFNGWMFLIVIAENNEEEIQRNLSGRARVGYLLRQGQWKKGIELHKQSLTESADDNGRAFEFTYTSESGASLGRCSEARTAAENSLAVVRDMVRSSISVQSLAWCGETSRAIRFLKEVQKKYPDATWVNKMSTPLILATIALKKGDPAEAVRLLEPVRPYQKVDWSSFWVQTVRAEAYLQMDQNEKAAAEYRDILDHIGRAPFSVRYPLARLGIARATKDKGEYEKFFEMWKEADEDLPVLIQAKKEYASLIAN